MTDDVRARKWLQSNNDDDNGGDDGDDGDDGDNGGAWEGEDEREE